MIITFSSPLPTPFSSCCSSSPLPFFSWSSHSSHLCPQCVWLLLGLYRVECLRAQKHGPLLLWSGASPTDSRSCGHCWDFQVLVFQNKELTDGCSSRGNLLDKKTNFPGRKQVGESLEALKWPLFFVLWLWEAWTHGIPSFSVSLHHAGVIECVTTLRVSTHRWESDTVAGYGDPGFNPGIREVGGPRRWGVSSRSSLSTEWVCSQLKILSQKSQQRRKELRALFWNSSTLRINHYCFPG